MNIEREWLCLRSLEMLQDMTTQPTHESPAVSALATPAVICVAPNGARRTKLDHPALPMSPDEIAREASACAEAGAAVIHLHVRDDQDGHSLDADRYRKAIGAIKSALGDRMIVQVTTEAVGIYRPPEQRALLRELCPQAASVAIRELIPDASHEDEAGRLFHWALNAGVGLQYIVYSPEEAKRVIDLAKRGIIPEPQPNTLFVLGRYTQGQQSSPHDLLPFLDGWPSDWPWSVCAFGKGEALCMAAAIALGGNVRVGFENNLSLANGVPASGNADLVANVRQLITCAGRPVASVEDARLVYRVR